MDVLPLDFNPLVSGGLVLMLAGGALYYLKRLPGQLYDFIERFFIVKIEILDEDESYGWMQVWLAERLRNALSVSVVTRRKRPHDPDDEDSDDGDGKPTVYFVPAVGTYFFWYRRRFVTLSRDRQENATAASPLPGTVGDARGLARHKESFTLRIFSRDRDLARRLVEECRDKALPDDGKLDIRVANYSCWSLGARVRPRPLRSVLLDGDQADELLADMKEFLVGPDWYRATGVPYRRGYLLYGPPGNGKTSVVKALAGELGLGIHLLMLSDPDVNDNRVGDLLAKVPDGNLLLLEDVDCAFVKRKRATGREGGLTFSGLLNALDGVATPEGRLVVMTTNHRDRLDPALIRPGRADVQAYFGNATADQARRLYERFFPDHAHRAGDFAAGVEDRRHSMAALQGYLMLHRRNPEEAVRRVYEIGRPAAGDDPSPPQGLRGCPPCALAREGR